MERIRFEQAREVRLFGDDSGFDWAACGPGDPSVDVAVEDRDRGPALLACFVQGGNGISQSGRVVVVGDQAGCSLSAAVLFGPDQHAPIGAKIGRVDLERLGQIIQCGLVTSKPPGGLRTQDEAVRSGGRGDSTASIGVGESCAEIPRGQGQRGAALQHEMMVAAEQLRPIIVFAEKQQELPRELAAWRAAAN